MIGLYGADGDPLDQPKTDPVQTAVGALHKLDVAFQAASTWESRLDILRGHFDLVPVRSSDDIESTAVYCLRSTDSTHFVTILPGDSNEDLIRLRDAMTGQQFKPLPKIKLLRLALKKFLVQLSPRISPSVSAQPAAQAEPAPSAEPEAVGPVRKRDEILDMGAFSQLCEAAKASGFVPNADLIAHVRDREFRLCDYQKAFQLIEGLYGKFMAAATQRQQRLKREETDIASGKTKMSPKEVQQKRARDTADTQRIGRTRTRFTRVLEGLRVLMRS